MYINLPVMMPWGINVSYWVVQQVTVVPNTTNTVNISFGGWYDAETFSNGLQPLLVNNLTVTIDPSNAATQEAVLTWVHNELLTVST